MPTCPASSRAFQLLCLCCAGALTVERRAAAKSLVEAGIDWPAVLSLVKRHRVAGLFFNALNTVGIKAPAPFNAQLAVLALRIRGDNQASAAESVRLQRRLDAAGIEARFFKGAALAQLAYGSLDIKHSKDIDVLVAPKDAPALVALLGEDGYCLWLPAPRIAAAHWPALIRFGHEVAMVRPGTNLQVEPHWRLTHNPHLLPGLDTRAPTAIVELPGHGSLKTFGRADTIAYLCVHGLAQGWVRLKALAELNALIEGRGLEELDALHAHAVERGVGPSVAVAFALCEALFSTAVPESIGLIVTKSPALRRLMQLSLRSLRDDAERPGTYRGAEIALLMAWSQKYFRSQFARSWVGLGDIVRFPLPRPLHPLYVVLRLPIAILRRIRGRTAEQRYPFPTVTPPETT